MRSVPHLGTVTVVTAFGVLLLIVGRGIQGRKCPHQREAYVPQSSSMATAEDEYVAPRMQYVGTEFPEIRSVGLTANEWSSNLDSADTDMTDIETADTETTDIEMAMIEMVDEVARDKDSRGDPGQVAAEYEAAVHRLADQWFFKKDPSQATSQVQSNPFAE
ncbi:hypothetical protein K227x_51590 [Rubripirellula lacrimiformis]|uniref:Transmembrane protein n=1 Tax=Rubripirellula lacrimiformis TaxID=1930273 RepID=A0A517NI68_9BACT|nr:hypothetical protein [Rubripirellula lacrimiformis]QDT06743.1 hypothetical protein K227x_51590 [Rubripirellula lacrimiformis]